LDAETSFFEFSRRHLPRRKTNVILHVSANSKTWTVAFLPHLTDRARYDWFSRGWSSFASDNSLQACDYCAFELLKSAEFLVHNFRVSEIQLPLELGRTLELERI
jgi:B3 DNA binding domain